MTANSKLKRKREEKKKIRNERTIFAKISNQMKERKKIVIKTRLKGLQQVYVIKDKILIKIIVTKLGLYFYQVIKKM